MNVQQKIACLTSKIGFVYCKFLPLLVIPILLFAFYNIFFRQKTMQCNLPDGGCYRRKSSKSTVSIQDENTNHRNHNQSYKITDETRCNHDNNSEQSLFSSFVNAKQSLKSPTRQNFGNQPRNLYKAQGKRSRPEVYSTNNINKDLCPFHQQKMNGGYESQTRPRPKKTCKLCQQERDARSMAVEFNDDYNIMDVGDEYISEPVSDVYDYPPGNNGKYDPDSLSSLNRFQQSNRRQPSSERRPSLVRIQDQTGIPNLHSKEFQRKMEEKMKSREAIWGNNIPPQLIIEGTEYAKKHASCCANNKNNGIGNNGKYVCPMQTEPDNEENTEFDDYPPYNQEQISKGFFSRIGSSLKDTLFANPNTKAKPKGQAPAQNKKFCPRCSSQSDENDRRSIDDSFDENLGSQPYENDRRFSSPQSGGCCGGRSRQRKDMSPRTQAYKHKAYQFSARDPSQEVYSVENTNENDRNYIQFKSGRNMSQTKVFPNTNVNDTRHYQTYRTAMDGSGIADYDLIKNLQSSLKNCGGYGGEEDETDDPDDADYSNEY